MENTVDTIIGINVTLKGNLKNKGSVQINGNVEGEIKSDENVNIGETATIKGPVVAKTIEVSGEVKGLIEATEARRNFHRKKYHAIRRSCSSSNR